VLAWSLLRGLHLDGLSMFDQLRLRQALADTFHTLGLSGEDGWRAAARVRFLLHRAEPLTLHLSHREWQDSDVQWLTGTHDSDAVRYFNQESHEELLWWIQLPALVAATPSEQRAAAQQSSAAVNRARQAAKDVGYRLDRLLAAESRSGRASEEPDARTSSRKGRKTATVKILSKAKGKSVGPRDGASAPVPESKSSAKRTETKKTAKKSSPSKRKP
jgi:hypothetical protein